MTLINLRNSLLIKRCQHNKILDDREITEIYRTLRNDVKIERNYGKTHPKPFCLNP
jgi:hypothetical protein